MSDESLTARTLRPFVPARDFGLCRRFYSDLGFTEGFANIQLAVFSLGTTSFYLQNYCWEGVDQHYMLTLIVEDVEAWWPRVREVAARYGVRAREPRDEAWGAREIHLIDPTGVLWHIARFGT